MIIELKASHYGNEQRRSQNFLMGCRCIHCIPLGYAYGNEYMRENGSLDQCNAAGGAAGREGGGDAATNE